MEAVLDEPDNAAILSNLPFPLFLLDKKGNIIFANDACEAFLGRARQRFVGVSILEYIEFEEGRVNKALLTNSSDLTAQNMKLIRPTSSSAVDISLSGYLQGNSEHRLITIIPRKYGHNHINENELAGNQQAIGAPVILGHEIKNPLAGIRGAAQLLARGADHTQKAMTELIVAEVDRIARLLDQMQNISGSKTLHVEPRNVHIILEQAIKSIRAANSEMPDIKVNYDPSIPDVLADFDALVQISINLLQNAVDALAAHSDPQIQISTRYVMSGALHEALDDASSGKTTKLPIEITISDNGPGIPENIVNEIFSPFVSSKRDGQGIGLAIVRNLVQQMNGRILFERDETPTAKTRFCIYLPTIETEKTS